MLLSENERAEGKWENKEVAEEEGSLGLHVLTPRGDIWEFPSLHLLTPLTCPWNTWWSGGEWGESIGRKKGVKHSQAAVKACSITIPEEHRVF